MKEIILTAKQLAEVPATMLIDGDFATGEVCIGGKLLRPDVSLKLRNHSPTGFAWGYGGSGPAQLALAILLKFLPQEVALDLYMDFKFNVVASWPQKDFEVFIHLRKWLTDNYTIKPQ